MSVAPSVNVYHISPPEYVDVVQLACATPESVAEALLPVTSGPQVPTPSVTVIAPAQSSFGIGSIVKTPLTSCVPSQAPSPPPVSKPPYVKAALFNLNLEA